MSCFTRASPLRNFFLRDEDGEWAHEFVSGEGALDMPEIGVAIPLTEIYEGVEFAS